MTKLSSTQLQAIVFNPPLRRTLLTTCPDIGFSSGQGVKVAILDSGVNSDVRVSHVKDLTGFGTSDGIPETHGTLVASIIQHFARNAELINIKVTHTKNNISWVNVMNGLKYARDMGAHIVNLSIGHYDGKQCDGTCPKCLEVQAFAKHSGMLIVASAGNEGPNDGTHNCPANAPDVISVGMVDETGYKVDLISSRATPAMKKPNLLASGYVHRDHISQRGTSFAAPVVTGVLAATYSAYSGNTARLVELLYNACEELLSIPFHHQGHGKLSLSQFVEVLNNETASFGREGQNTT